MATGLQAQVMQIVKQTGLDPQLGYVPVTVAELAQKSGYERTSVNKAVNNLVRAGKLEVVRGSDGFGIAGFRIGSGDHSRGGEKTVVPGRIRLDTPQLLRGGKRIAVPPSGIEEMPSLDAYARTKSDFERMARDFPKGMKDTQWQPDPIAEEALALRAKYIVLRSQHGDLVDRVQAAETEARSLRRQVERLIAEKNA